MRKLNNPKRKTAHANPLHFRGPTRDIVQAAVDKRARKALKLGSKPRQA